MNDMITRVTAAILVKNDRVLVAQRMYTGKLAGKWEFPGGKIEHGETIEQALVREIQEELDAPIMVSRVYPGYLFEYKNLKAEFIPVSGSIAPREITLLEHDECKFIELGEIGNYEISPYDNGAISLLNSKRFERLN